MTCNTQHRTWFHLAGCHFSRRGNGYNVYGEGQYATVYTPDPFGPGQIWLFRTEEEAREDHKTGPGSRVVLDLAKNPHAGPELVRHISAHVNVSI